jgi:MFS superfamily sulfate permease-like transporter
VTAEDGKMTLYLKEKTPEGAKTDGRIWRIRLGNKRVNEKEVVIMGGGGVVGNVPKGLPTLGIPQVKTAVVLKLLPAAIIISLLGFMEAIAIAKAMASKTGQRIDPNQELIGQGVANIMGSIGQSYPTSGSFSRSAVNLQSGAVTGLSSVITSIVVVIALLFLTPLLYHLPNATLAAVIMMAVIGLLNVSGFVHAWKTQWYDGAISIITFIFTLVFAPHLEKGIYVGVVLSLGMFLYKSMRPKISSLSRHEDESLREIGAHQLAACEYIDLIRFEGPLFFANASYLEEEIDSRIVNRKNLKHIIIAANGINDIDTSGEETLALIVDRLRSSGYGISLSGVNETVMAVLKRTHLFENIGGDNIFPTMEKAIRTVYDQTHRDSQEKTCPLLTTCRHLSDVKN